MDIDRVLSCIDHETYSSVNYPVYIHNSVWAELLQVVQISKPSFSE